MVDSTDAEKRNPWPPGRSMLVLVSLRKRVHSQLSNGLREGGRAPLYGQPAHSAPALLPALPVPSAPEPCEWSSSSSRMSTPWLSSNIPHYCMLKTCRLQHWALYVNSLCVASQWPSETAVCSIPIFQMKDPKCGDASLFTNRQTWQVWIFTNLLKCVWGV